LSELLGFPTLTTAALGQRRLCALRCCAVAAFLGELLGFPALATAALGQRRLCALRCCAVAAFLGELLGFPTLATASVGKLLVGSVATAFFGLLRAGARMRTPRRKGSHGHPPHEHHHQRGGADNRTRSSGHFSTLQL
jgi:hypothetical protein